MAIIPETEVVVQFAYDDRHILGADRGLLDTLIFTAGAGQGGEFTGGGLGTFNHLGEPLAYQSYSPVFGAHEIFDVSYDVSEQRLWTIGEDYLGSDRGPVILRGGRVSAQGMVATYDSSHRDYVSDGVHDYIQEKVRQDGAFDVVAADKNRVYLGTHHVEGNALDQQVQSMTIIDFHTSPSGRLVGTVSNEVRRFAPYNDIPLGAYDIHNGWEGQWEANSDRGTFGFRTDLQAYFRKIQPNGEYEQDIPEYSITDGEWNGIALSSAGNTHFVKATMYGPEDLIPNLFYIHYGSGFRDVNGAMFYRTIEDEPIAAVVLYDNRHPIGGAYGCALVFKEPDPDVVVDLVCKRIAMVSTGALAVGTSTGGTYTAVPEKRVMVVQVDKEALPDLFYETRLQGSLFYLGSRYLIESWEVEVGSSVVKMEVTF